MPDIRRMPREVPNECLCRWENTGRQGGMMRLAEIGPRCPVHTPPGPGAEPLESARKSACRCVWVPTGVGWTRRMIWVDPDCANHGGSVRLGEKDVAPWARSVT